ncbi:dihydroxyacetone kinase DhaL subunit [Geodermatophilus aquaeductus]|uniref:Dihydroxyacetone kinase DhaL subunit n=1 Tax=Geodermatophilus aquaeductus TaxID=1564161 RepID=A0A521CHB3_9ACTN|nr:dihydroxyacetone kinase subunit DhaL [Geodermatophilus aquaeductus]SMO58131.1 dihydroxyacetone kinase DhaL subunit [Geodermatophilus aquaeductus]
MSVAVGTDDLTAWLRRFAEVVHERRDELTALDAAIGDADHGSNMDRGMAAVVAVLDDAPPADPAGLLKKTGATLVSKVGGASGPLYGTFFLRMAGAAGDGDLDDAAVARAVRAGLEGVVARGKAEPGDKTMVDALGPACDALDAAVGAGKPLADALAAAAEAAVQGRDATVPMVARKGRASYLGERSAGHMDPGATSVTLLVEAAAATLGRP